MIALVLSLTLTILVGCGDKASSLRSQWCQAVRQVKDVKVIKDGVDPIFDFRYIMGGNPI